MAREWIDETARWILGKWWLPLAVGNLVLAAFGGGELLDIAIPTCYLLLKNHGISRAIEKLLTNGEGPIHDRKSKLFNLGR